MNGASIYSAIGIGIFLPVLYLLFHYLRAYSKQSLLIKKEIEEASRRLYELAVLKELGERVGYSLNVEEILQIITGSLKQFIDYTAVGYVVILPEKLKTSINIDVPVGDIFLREMKERMLGSISALTDKDYSNIQVDDVLLGALVVDEIKENIGSFFNIPLVISGEVAGVLTIAHTEKGLYGEDDMTILYKITKQASEAVSRLQEVVKMEQGKLNAMVQSMGDGVLMVDSEYKVVVANPAIRRIIGVSDNQPINIFNFVDMLGGKFDIHGRLEEAVAKKTSYISERINVNEVFYEVGVYPVAYSFINKGEKIIGAVVVFHDITRDIELERVREEFTSMIVHELRSPLDGIKKITELIVSGNIKPESNEFKEYINMTHQSSSSMLELVNDILDLSKLQSGKFEVVKEKSNIKEVIENRISFYKVTTSNRNLSISSFIEENIPSEILFDPQAVKQILNNFISNAIKFTSTGGSVLVSAFVSSKDGGIPKGFIESFPRNEVRVFVGESELKNIKNSLCVVVSDTGIGIPEDSQKDLFHTFKQARLSPIDKESKGTGLGLVIAKGITEAHGGKIGFVSKEGVGTSFYFTIPL